MSNEQTTDRRVAAAGLAIVLLLHAAVLWGLWRHRLLPTPREAITLFVNFIAPPAPKVPDPPMVTPVKPRPVRQPQPRQLVAETPAIAPTDYVAPLPPPPQPSPVIEAPSAPVIAAAPAPAPAPAPKPSGPVSLGSELSVACPERTPPVYPSISRRLVEEGTVTLRVELDEQGNVASARVSISSNHSRLDEAALAAVRTWRCTPPTRNGQPVRAVAVQPFKFMLQGN